LQEILAKGQSRISTHLAQLKQAGLVDDRRAGKNAFYRLKAPAELMGLLRKAAREIPEADEDRQALRLAMRQRQDKMRRYFDGAGGQVRAAVRAGAVVEGIAEALLKLMPPMVIADLGAGEGTLSQLMAQRARKVIAIDNSEKMVEFGAALARQARHRQPGIPLGRPRRRAHPHLHGGPGVSEQALHHAAHPERAHCGGMADSEAGRANRDPWIWAGTTSRRRGRCTPTCGWDSRSWRSSAI